MLSTSPIEIRNYKLFNADSGEEFVVRGIDYYPRPNQGILDRNSVDFCTEEHQSIWERDIPHLQELGVNAIRLYAVNATLNHDAFMCRLEQAGIYVVVALAHDCPTCAITKDAAPDCYPPELKRQGQQVIRAFARYPNVLAFSAGNEVNHYTPSPDQPQWNAPCQKKFLRDMRAYVASCPHLRKIPVGLVSADSERQATTLYYNCQDNPEDMYQNAEWYGLNSYVYCSGDATKYEEALGFQKLVNDYRSYEMSIPVLLTEFGCISDSFVDVQGYRHQRTFRQAQWMLDVPEVRDVFAGGFAFEYSMELANGGTPNGFSEQNFGVGYLEPTECDDVEILCNYTRLPSFNALQRAYRESTIVDVAYRGNFTVSENRTRRSACPSHFPALGDFVWEADSIPDLPCPLRRRFTCPTNRYKFLDRSMVTLSCIATFIGLLALVTGGVMVGRRKRDRFRGKVLVLPGGSDKESESLLSMNRVDETGYESLGPSSEPSVPK